MIQALSQEAETLAWKILLETNQHGLVPVDSTDVEFYLRSLLFRSRKRLDYWTEPKLSRALNELRARGVVRILVHDERAWLELHEDLRYHRFANKGAKPEQFEDTPLPLSRDGPELFPFPPPDDGWRSDPETPAKMRQYSSESREEQIRKEREKNARANYFSQNGNGEKVDTSQNGNPTLKEVLSACSNLGIEKAIGEIWYNEMQGTADAESGEWKKPNGARVTAWQFTLSAYAQKWVSNNQERNKARGDKKKPARVDYKPKYLPPINEITEEELAAQRAIVREASAKLREELKIAQ